FEPRDAAEVIHGGQVREHLEPYVGVVAERGERVTHQRPLEVRDGLPAHDVARPERAGRQDRGQPLKKLRLRHAPIGGGAPSVPLERALAPHVHESDREYEDEDAHLNEPEDAERTEQNCPRVHEHHLDVEDDEQNRSEIEFHRETPPRGAARRIAALEGRLLHGRGTARAEEHAGRDEHRRTSPPSPNAISTGTYWNFIAALRSDG